MVDIQLRAEQASALREQFRQHGEERVIRALFDSADTLRQDSRFGPVLNWIREGMIDPLRRGLDGSSRTDDEIFQMFDYRILDRDDSARPF